MEEKYNMAELYARDVIEASLGCPTVTKITFNPDNEMMVIEKDKRCIFTGNYWDFDRSPVGIEEFLKELGLPVQCLETEEELI